MTFVTNCLQLIVKLSNFFSSFNVYRVFIFKSAYFISGNKAKELNIFDKVFQYKTMFCIFFKIIKVKLVKVAD